MAILNITYNGRSATLPAELDGRLSDDEIRRIAVEVVRTGGLLGLVDRGLRSSAFNHFVVDRIHDDAGTLRLYLRPKVPFGQGR